MKKVASIVLNDFKNDSRVLKENISLQNAGYNVKVVALHNENLKEYDTIQEIHVHRIKLRSKKFNKHKAVQLLKYLEFIYKVVQKYKDSDILHCNDLNTLPIAFIIKKFFNKGVKIIYDAHEYEINDKPNQSIKSIKFLYYVEKFFIRYADKVITVSDSIANEYVKLYSIDKPELVLNTPPYKKINKKNIFRRKFNIDPDQVIFLYQGGLSKGRGIEILLEAFQSIKDSKYVLIFLGYGSLTSLIKGAIKNSNNIFYHQAVMPDILLNYTSSADFGISTIEDSCLSFKYCLPNKMFEYLMADIPVIVSNLPEMKSFILKYNVGLVLNKNNSENLKEVIKEAVNLSRKELKNNISQVKLIYNWEEQEKILLKVYKGLYSCAE